MLPVGVGVCVGVCAGVCVRVRVLWTIWSVTTASLPANTVPSAPPPQCFS